VNVYRRTPWVKPPSSRTKRACRFRLHPRMSPRGSSPSLKKYEAFAGLVRRRGCRLVVEEEVAVEDAAVAVAVEDDRFEGGTTRVARAMTASDHTIAEH